MNAKYFEGLSFFSKRGVSLLETAVFGGLKADMQQPILE